jgi:hypothetical protein
MSNIVSRPYDKSGEETWERVFGNNLTPYEKLIERVRKINSDAAKYLETEAKDLPNFMEVDDLCCVMEWKLTPQGHDYWSSINKILERNI